VEAKGWRLLHSLLKWTHKEEGAPPNLESLATFLPEEERAAFLQEKEEGAPLATKIDLAAPFQDYHYSWLQAPLNKAPPAFRSLAVRAFPEPTQSALQKTLDLEKKEPILAPGIRHFILSLFARLYAPDMMPIEQEANRGGKLAPLLKLEKKALLELVDLLGLWDLSHDVKRVIDRKLLHTIFLSLSEKEQSCLKKCLQAQDVMPPHSLDLTNWNGEQEELLRLLTIRGLARLGKALSGQPLEVIKALVRRLDTGRAQQLMGYVSKKEIPRTSAAAIGQVLQAIVWVEE
jgi:hypothetical protein